VNWLGRLARAGFVAIARQIRGEVPPLNSTLDRQSKRLNARTKGEQRLSREKIIAFLSLPYGSTPAERVYWGNFRAAIRTVAASFTDPPLQIICADEEVEALRLTQHVGALIDKADFTIAVITGANPNVLWEIGYTDGQGKPVVILNDADDPAAARSPVLLAEILKCTYSSSMLERMSRTTELPNEFTDRFSRFLSKAIRLALGQRIPNIALVRSNRQLAQLALLIADARQRIHLITTNLGYFADLDQFTVERSEPRYAFDDPVERGVDVRILTLDPDSPLVQYRARQLGLGYDIAHYREELRNSARRMYHRYRERRNVTIRVYDDLPLQITLLVDDTVVTCIMGRGRLARANIHFVVNRFVPGVMETFEGHFSQVAAGPSEHIGAFGWALRSPGSS
jgi:nucleoside 2-deoxyribosyltransferase